jgi:hypothetical protein
MPQSSYQSYSKYVRPRRRLEQVMFSITCNQALIMQIFSTADTHFDDEFAIFRAELSTYGDALNYAFPPPNSEKAVWVAKMKGSGFS